ERAGAAVGQGGDVKSRRDNAVAQRLHIRNEAVPPKLLAARPGQRPELLEPSMQPRPCHEEKPPEKNTRTQAPRGGGTGTTPRRNRRGDRPPRAEQFGDETRTSSPNSTLSRIRTRSSWAPAAAKVTAARSRARRRGRRPRRRQASRTLSTQGP